MISINQYIDEQEYDEEGKPINKNKERIKTVLKGLAAGAAVGYGYNKIKDWRFPGKEPQVQIVSKSVKKPAEGLKQKTSNIS